MFQLYAQDKKRGWISEKNYVSDDLDELELIAEEFTSQKYYSYLIVEHTPKGDRTVRRQELYQGEIERCNDFKKKYKVNITQTKLSRTKQKQELKKEIDKHMGGEKDGRND